MFAYINRNMYGIRALILSRLSLFQSLQRSPTQLAEVETRLTTVSLEPSFSFFEGCVCGFISPGDELWSSDGG